MKVITFIHKGKVQTITLEELRTMKVELTNAWESVCNNCGKCCFDKTLSSGNLIINYDKPCPHLKFTGRKSSCDCYDKRFDLSEKCYTVPEAIQNRCLPPDCPYTKKVVGYKAPIDNGGWYKSVRVRLTKDAIQISSGAQVPTGGTRNEAATPPPRLTAEDVRYNRKKPQDWKRRKVEALRRKAGKPEGTIDPREKTDFNIKPSGHALGG